MKHISLSPINYSATFTGEQIQEKAQNKPGQKKDGKKLLIAGAVAAAAIGAASIILTRNMNINKAKRIFNGLVDNSQKGNNNILSDALKAENEAVQKFIDEKPDSWERIKESILNIVDVKNADEVLGDNIFYHGTDVKSAKNILSNGVTPFSPKRSASGSSMGHGFYTTPDLKTAQFFAGDGIVLPFKINGKIATMKEGFEPELVKNNVIYAAMCGEGLEFAKNNQSSLVTKAMQELGIDAIYTESATTRAGILGGLNQAPKFVDKAGQVAIFNGSSVELIPDKAKELCQITPQNYSKFI